MTLFFLLFCAAGTVASCTADVLVSRRASEANPPREIRVAIIGNVDSGKSTLVGVLTRSMLDDGRGLARGKVCENLRGGGRLWPRLAYLVHDPAMV